MDHGRPYFRRNSTCSALLRFHAQTGLCFSLTGLSPSLAGFPNTLQLNISLLTVRTIYSSLRHDPLTPTYATPVSLHVSGLGSSPFAHHYSENLCDFFSLRLLRCFTSPASPPLRGSLTFVRGVPPFGHPRLVGCLLLPGAFRRSLRPSSLSDAIGILRMPLLLYSLIHLPSRILLSSYTGKLQAKQQGSELPHLKS